MTELGALMVIDLTSRQSFSVIDILYRSNNINKCNVVVVCQIGKT